MNDPTSTDANAAPQPSVAAMLTSALPDHTHVHGLFGGVCCWTWSTPAGVWSVTAPELIFGKSWTVNTPYGQLSLPWKQARPLLLPLLVALGGIDGGPTDG